MVADITLFDNIGRHDVQPADYGEPLFGYYNRSAREECQRAREILEQWFAAYPPSAKVELRSRFRSSDEYNHAGAFFELYCYTLLTKQGFDVELHPDLDGAKGSHPDFKVARSGRPLFYLESTVALSRDHAEERSLHQIYDYLNRNVRSPDFFLHVSVLGDIPRIMLSLSSLRNKLHAWLNCLNADEVTARAVAMLARGRGLDGLPQVIVEQDGWRIEFKAMPVATAKRGRPDHRPVGVIARRPTSSWVDSQKPLLPALRKKAGGYGELDSPFVIAINSQDFTETFDVECALFGKEGVSVNRDTGDAKPMRFEDGLWTAGGGQYGRVSGVLITSLLGPLTIARLNAVLWHNPWATHPLDQDLWHGSQMIPDQATGTMQPLNGAAAWEILGVAPGGLE